MSVIFSLRYLRNFLLTSLIASPPVVSQPPDRLSYADVVAAYHEKGANQSSLNQSRNSKITSQHAIEP
jgi:hypothetical protein